MAKIISKRARSTSKPDQSPEEFKFELELMSDEEIERQIAEAEAMQSNIFIDLTYSEDWVIQGPQSD